MDFHEIWQSHCDSMYLHISSFPAVSNTNILTLQMFIYIYIKTHAPINVLCKTLKVNVITQFSKVCNFVVECKAVTCSREICI
jgi:hypothetical protein